MTIHNDELRADVAGDGTAAAGLAPVADTRMRRDSIVTSVAGLAVYGSALLTSPLTARALGPSGRGDLTAVTGPTMMLMWMLTFGLPTAAMYHAHDLDRRALVMGAWAFGLVVGGLVVAAVWPFVPDYLAGHSDITVPWFRAYLLISVAFVPCYVALDLSMADRRVIAYNVLRITPFMINAAAIVGLAVVGRLTLNSALASQFVGYVIWYVVAFAFLRAWPSPGFQWSVLRAELHYGSKVWLGSLSNYVVTRLDQVLLVGLVASAQLGFYGVAVNVAGISQPIAFALYSNLFARLRLNRRGDSRALEKQTVRWAFWTSLGCSAVIAVLVPVIVPLAFGDEFRGAVAPVLLLLPGQIAYNVGLVFAGRLQAHGRPGKASQGQLVAAVVTVVGLAVAIGPYGILGAAVVTSVSQFAYLGYLVLAVARGPARRPDEALTATSQ